MKITPSARILRMLGEIEFDEWQCVAELLDNAFDDFTEITRLGIPWAGGFRVSVSLPSSSIRSSEAQVVIMDTGRGMSYETLEHAVRAGWSSNDRFDKLGLFGMGFNVSTARLGRRTRVLTTRAGDPEWIGVEIDLDRIGDDFEADDITEPKVDPNEHGTRIEISRLHPARADWLRRNEANLRQTLGRVYSWILDNRPFELWVQGKKVKPRRHCRWGDDRYVTFGTGAKAEKIPAYIAIDERLEDAAACLDCGNWQHPGDEVCGQCDGSRLVPRERRIHGWLGVQRHLHKREFGIDFLRNGRKILQWDQSLFQWKNPDNPLAALDIEYPIELANQGGRLIGEIHLDHVPVTYQKDAFEYSDRSWRGAVQLLRGVGPLLPNKARDAGYPENNSHLAKLVKGFRRNDAGLRYLTPGDGSRPIHEETRRWADRFHRGDEEYQTDAIWWDAVVRHDGLGKKAKVDRAKQHTPAQPDEQAVLEALGLGAKSSEDRQPDIAPPTPEPKRPTRETSQERIDRYSANSVSVPRLSKDFGLRSLGAFLSIDARRLHGTRLQDDHGQETPILLVQRDGRRATAFIDPEHESLARHGIDESDLLLVEIASVLKVKTDSRLTLSSLVVGLRAECLPDSVNRVETVGAEARELLSDIRERMAAKAEQDPARAFELLSPDELTATENELIASGRVASTQLLGENAEFIIHAPALFIVKLLESWPEAFMDGNVFSGPYVSVSSPSARRLSLARTAGYLTDVATVTGFSSSGVTDPVQLQRTRLSVRLLADELAGEG
ncbi:ATP-binding protein [Streptomyces sp. NPDC001890]|uniref:ATP-binding protein n=1 Tax=Streptomyces sp. NPDC001890 TaxID=3364620 RepID=UPI0036C0F8B2